MSYVDIDIEIPNHIYDYFAKIALKDGVKVEDLMSDIVSQRLESAVTWMEEQHGL